MKYCLISLLLCHLSSLLAAQNYYKLRFPNHEQVSSYNILYVLQDEEGFLWYATDGGGLCRDDGRQIIVFRSDAEHKDLLGSNNVVCLAEAGNRILIGTTHGANVLCKDDYSIRRLAEVDDKRVDDIVITTDGHWWLTANKKLYEYSAEGRLLRILDTGDKYIFRLHEDRQGRLWCTQWEGGQLLLNDDGRFVQLTTEWPDSIDFRRVTIDCHGGQLVADGFGECYAMCTSIPKSWFHGEVLTRQKADSVRAAWGLSARPTAFAASNDNSIMFSTGKDVRQKNNGAAEIVVSATRDVSAMAFAPDGRLWMATIYGQLYCHHKGRTEVDAYGSNEYGDGVIAMTADSIGRLLLVSDRYVRIYDPQRQTMRQQSRAKDGDYLIELQETKPHSRWSVPSEQVKERLPAWLTSWWMWCVYVLLSVSVVGLAVHNVILLRQRRLFMQQMRISVATDDKESASQDNIREQPLPSPDSEWLQSAIAKVEAHMSDEGYTVEQLSSDMCMSRMTFYRKIQGVTGQKPTEFIRTIRLRHAAELLREGHLTVSEISVATGFSSVSYFSRCFRSMFGVPPTQF